MNTKMSITPSHLTIGTLFSYNFIFRLPKYQRYYSWTREEIDDFMKDLELCASARSLGKNKPHFFGGIVTVDQPIQGSARQNVEVIDGQQRLASFLMLIVNIKNAMQKLAIDTLTEHPELSNFLTAKHEALQSQYETYKDTVNLEVIEIPRLELSKPDKDFFQQMLMGLKPTSQRKSHELLKDAFERIGSIIDKRIQCFSTPKEKATYLASLASILDEDWTVIHMATRTRAEAYMLFQVLNDRGMGLTEGELLRAKSLEILDNGKSSTYQQFVENCWDQILSISPERVEESLRWIYSSYKGSRPGKTTLFDDCLEFFFPMHGEVPLSLKSASTLNETVANLQKDFQDIALLIDGEWPYPIAQPITKWDTERLRLLTVELKHTNCIPLLLAAKKLPPKKFSEIVQLLERFVFRYKVICNAHIGPATTVYQNQAIEIRKNPSKYQVSSLKNALSELIKNHADDSKFKALLAEVKYSRTSSNKPIKYFLSTIEYFSKWYVLGAKGVPACKDKSRIIDFNNSTIEHIYPANSSNPDPKLEPLIDTIGNLTLLGQDDNVCVGNDSFSSKRSYYSASTISLNQTIAANMLWNEESITKWKETLIEMAVKIFAI